MHAWCQPVDLFGWVNGEPDVILRKQKITGDSNRRKHIQSKIKIDRGER